MTATDELRRMLDERGVEWEDMSIRPYACTSWYDQDGEPCTALEGADDIPDGKLSVGTLLIPAQAIAATLGETPTPPPPTPPKQPPYDLLIDLLRDEWGIDVSWDGLRRFWYVGLNEKVVRCRECIRLREIGPVLRCEHVGRFVRPEYFCVWGERRADA